MSNYLLSKKADEDSDGIAVHSLELFGDNQARKYITGLFTSFDSSNSNPDLGRSAIEYAPRLKKYRFQTHMIFYEKTFDGVFIVKILDQRQDFQGHF
jgi:toxin ParE1/3/4